MYLVEPLSTQLNLVRGVHAVVNRVPQIPPHGLPGLQCQHKPRMRRVIVELHRIHLPQHVCLNRP